MGCGWLLVLTFGHHGVENALLDPLGGFGVVEEGPAFFADFLLDREGYRAVRQDVLHERVELGHGWVPAFRHDFRQVGRLPHRHRVRASFGQG